MDVILHLGAHRCGTTTFQRYLERNQTALEDAGVVNWGPRRTRGGLFSGLVQRPRAVTPDIARRGLRSCGLMRLEVDELTRAGYRELIISDENMIGTINANLQDRQLYPEAVARLARFVSGTGENPRRIGLCIRSYDKLWASAMCYSVSRGRPIPSLAQLRQLVDQPRRWKDVILGLAAVFPRSDIVVWPFERFAGQPDRQLSLLTNGLTFGSAVRGRRDWFNRSPDRAAMRDLAEPHTLAPEITATLMGEGHWMPFNAEQEHQLRSDYADDLDWLRSGADGVVTFTETIAANAAADRTNYIRTSGFTASDRTWVPPRGRQNNDTEEIVV